MVASEESPNLLKMCQRQQICRSEAMLVAFAEDPIMLECAKGSRYAGWRPIWLPLLKTQSCSKGQRQQFCLSGAILVASAEDPILPECVKGSRYAGRDPC